MDKKVVIIGAGGQGRVISDIVSACKDNVIGFIDDNKDAHINGFEYLGDMSVIDGFLDCTFIIAVGDNETRKRIADKYPKLNYYTAIHPSAVISPTTVIGAGTCIMPNVTVNSMAEIGKHSIINSNTVVEHDCRVGDFVHLSPHTTVGGTVTIGDLTWIGIGASIVNNITICGGVTVGAGAVVNKDIAEAGTYVGVPVHKVEKK